MSDQHSNNGQVEQPQHIRPFNPKEHLIQIKGRNGLADYLPVQWRLVWFRSVYPNGSVETEMLHFDPDREVEAISDIWNEQKQQSEKMVKRGTGLAIFKATVKDSLGGVGTGTKSETAANFPDFIEAAETGAIGRALASLGFGTQFAPELQEEHRIVDSPVARARSSSYTNTTHQPVSSAQTKVAENRAPYDTNGHSSIDPQAPMSEQQWASIRKLCQHLGKSEPPQAEIGNYLSAQELLTQLTREYRQSRKKAS